MRRTARAALRSIMFAAAVLGSAMFPGGCAAPAAAGAVATPPVFTILEEFAPSGAVLASDLCPITRGQRDYVIVDDDGVATGDALLVQRTPRGEDGESVEVDVGEDLTLYLQALDDGGVAQAAAVSHDQQALTRFDPPLVIAYAELPPGPSRESQAAMRVVDVRDTRRQRESGNVVRTMEYVGDARLDTPIGELLAQRVDVHFSAKLRLARVERRETIWVVPGMGVVARDDQEKLTIFALPAKNERRRMVISARGR